MPDTVQIGGGPQGNGNTGANNSGEGTLAPNTILLRRYRIMGVIGGGGMGTVYQARDLNFPDVKRMAAVKEMLTLSSDRALREQTLATFQREANILATLAHPAIPNIYDFFDQNNRAYLVMEYINGSDLENILGKTRTLPMEKIIEWTRDLCDVLTYLHGQQPNPIIFRDMKPSNLMIDSLGKVRLIDFGIAKMFEKGKHTTIGTEGYSAPEQYKGNVSPLSDQYSLGATLHHILTRKDPRLEPPFSFHERSIREYNPDVPIWFAEIMERALQFNPSDRYPSIANMGEAIRVGMSTPAIVVDDLPEEGELHGNEVEPKWTFKTEDEVRSSPTAYGDTVFVGSYDTNVWALNIETGDLVWKYATEGGIASSPVVDRGSGLVLFGSEDNTFYAVQQQSGKLVWTFPTKDRIRSSPIVAMDLVFFGSDDGHLYALIASNGRSMWNFDALSPIRNRPLVYTEEEIVIFGTDMGEIIAVSLSGERKWQYRTRRPILSSPIIDEKEGACFIGGNDGFLYALDAARGNSSWRFPTNSPIISTPALYKQFVIFGSANGSLYALDTMSSRERWRFTTEAPIVSSPVVHGENVYVGSTDHHLYCLEAKTGQEKWKFKTEGEITSTPLIINDTIIFGSLDHKVYALPIFD